MIVYMEFKNLSTTGNVLGLSLSLVSIVLGIFSFFGDTDPFIKDIAFPLSIITTVIIVAAIIVLDKFNQQSKRARNIDKKLTKIEDHLSIDSRFRKIEEKLIRYETLINQEKRK